MLKTTRDGQVWLITQPAHAELSGQMAAHWGNEEFAVPGYFAASADSERLRQEVVLAVAEHDNGWWEWEADPPLSADDGLPQGLGEVVANPVAGMERWRLGIPRLAERHPYASLLIGDHAHWLYEAQFNPRHPPELTHHLLLGRAFYPEEQKEEARRFLNDVQEMRLYPDFPKSTNTLYLYILRAKLSVRPAQVDGIYVNIISHGSTPARTRACSDTTPRPDALYRALSRLDAVSDQAHVNVTHCQI